MPTPINISASRGAAILGLSKWNTPARVWLQIMESLQPGFCARNNFLLPEFDEEAVLRWGKAFESAIIDLAENRRGVFEITNREKLCFHAKHDFITCHIDGEYDYATGHEGKTTSAFYYRDNFGEPGTDEVPMEYQIQCQHQLLCNHLWKKVVLSVLVFPRRVEEWEEMGYVPMELENGIWSICVEEISKGIAPTCPLKWARTLDEMGYFHQYEIYTHPELQERMIAHYNDFWHENVLGQIPPEPQDYLDIKSLIREPVGTVVADEHIERKVAEYKQIGREISNTGELGKRREMLKVEILDWTHRMGAKVEDDDSADKYVIRDRSGKKIASYYRDKNGNFIFR